MRNKYTLWRWKKNKKVDSTLVPLILYSTSFELHRFALIAIEMQQTAPINTNIKIYNKLLSDSNFYKNTIRIRFVYKD